MNEILLNQYRCTRCGHEWLEAVVSFVRGRARANPTVCPKDECQRARHCYAEWTNYSEELIERRRRAYEAAYPK